jgi:alpha-beta hydrolase superfamily lysophospholipase
LGKRHSKIIILLIAGYFLITSVLYLLQDKIIFQADKLPADYEFEFKQDFAEVSIIPRIDKEINGLIFSASNARLKGTIIYFHGNADNMQRWGEYAEDFTSLGYAVLMIDYSGYGKTLGTPSEEKLFQDAEDTWQWAQHHLASKDFIIYGRSLGAAVASQLASQHQPKQLILETPFYQLRQSRLSFFFPFGLKYQFANYKYLPQVKCPVTIIQGTNDRIVSYKSAEKLKQFLKPADIFITIEAGGHKDLRQFEQYHIELAKVLE